MGEGTVAFDDVFRGHVEFDVSNLGGDFVIVRADGSPLYHFTVVVDDAAMAITDVIRGEDHLSNTPKHILRASVTTCRASGGGKKARR